MQRLALLLLGTTPATVIPEVTSSPTPISTCGDEGVLPFYGSACGLSIDWMKEICTDSSTQAFNKHNATVGILNKKMVPVSCIDVQTPEQEEECKDDKESFFAFRERVDQDEVVAFKKERKEKLEAWNLKSVDQLDRMTAVTAMTPDQEKITDKLYEDLINLREFYAASCIIDEKKKGNCGDQVNASIIKLLKYSQEYGLPLKIQLFAVMNSKSPGPIVDHDFLLLNGDSLDVNILNNKKKVAKYLKSIKTGMICDRWNKGLFVPFTEDKTNLYNDKAGWDELLVKTVVSFDFGQLNKLPLNFKRFFCKELSEMGLSVEPTDTCGMFKPKDTSSEKPKKKKQSKKP